MRLNYISILPFITFSAIVFYCWYQLLANNYVPDTKHIITLILVLINIGVYFIGRVKGLAMTGLVLFAASFSLIAVNVVIVTNSFFIKLGGAKITFPAINYLSLFLLFFYCVINHEIVKKGIKYIFNLF